MTAKNWSALAIAVNGAECWYQERLEAAIKANSDVEFWRYRLTEVAEARQYLDRALDTRFEDDTN